MKGIIYYFLLFIIIWISKLQFFRNNLYEFNIELFSKSDFKSKLIGITFNILMYVLFFSLIIPLADMQLNGIHLCIE